MKRKESKLKVKKKYNTKRDEIIYCIANTRRFFFNDRDAARPRELMNFPCQMVLYHHFQEMPFSIIRAMYFVSFLLFYYFFFFYFLYWFIVHSVVLEVLNRNKSIEYEMNVIIQTEIFFRRTIRTYTEQILFIYSLLVF